MKQLKAENKDQGVFRIVLPSEVGKTNDKRKVLLAKSNLNKRKCTLEQVLLLAIAIGCALVCALSVYWMKYQADTIKNLEGQLEGSKAQLQMILDNERSKHQLQIQTQKTLSSDEKVPIF